MKKPSGVQTDGSTQNLVDVAEIDRLARIVSQYDLSEIEISLGDLKVRLARERRQPRKRTYPRFLRRRRWGPIPPKAPPSLHLHSSRPRPTWSAR